MKNKYILSFKEAVQKLLEEKDIPVDDQDIRYDSELLKKVWNTCEKYIKDLKDMDYNNSLDIYMKVSQLNGGFKRDLEIIYDILHEKFTSPKEQEFLNQWESGDGIISLIDYVWEHKNEFKS